MTSPWLIAGAASTSDLCYLGAVVLGLTRLFPRGKPAKTTETTSSGETTAAPKSASASPSTFVNPHAQKAWEKWGGFLSRDEYARDSKGNRMRPDSGDTSYKFIHTYPQFIQDGFWDGKDAYYPCLNPWYLYHYPIHDCPKCGAKEPWAEPLVDSRYGSNSYYDKELQRNLATSDDWRCAECDERTVFDTRTGQFAYTRGLFGIKRRANWMYGVGGWEEAVFETVLVVALAIILGSILLRMLISFLHP